MKKEMLINVLQPEECRIAILEDGVLEELYVERTSHESYVGNIYKGRIVNIEPSIQAAFVDFGVGRNGFLHVSDVEPAYYRHLVEPRRENGRRGRRRSGPPAGDEPARSSKKRAEPASQATLPWDELEATYPESSPSSSSVVPAETEQGVGPEAVEGAGPFSEESQATPEVIPFQKEPNHREGANEAQEATPGATFQAPSLPPSAAGEPHSFDPENSLREKPKLMDSAERHTDENDPALPPLESSPLGDLSDEDLTFSHPAAPVTHQTAPVAARAEEPATPLMEEEAPADEAEELAEEDVEASIEAPLSEEEEEPFFEEDEEELAPRRRSRGEYRPRGRRSFARAGAGRPKPLIQDIFKRGQEVLVQVIKEGIGTKGPTLSTYISIAGRYLVLMPGLNRIGVSRKITDEDSRHRLREVLHDLQPPKGLGFIIRTAGLDRNKKELQRDLAYLARLWQVVVRRIRKMKAGSEIYQESDMITRTIRDTFTSEIDTIWVDEKAAFEHAQEFLQIVMPRYANRIKLYDEPEPMFHKYGIENEIARIQQRHVPLPNGGSIVIDQTEALVAIDVNSGNFRADNNAEETAYQMNLLAAKEIARQLRLRDLGGVIVNDFIDMRDEKHRRGVERALREAVRRDRARTKILKISAFGIIEMTRQRIRPSLKRSVYQDCPHCLGSGQVKTCESMSIDVMRLVQLAAHRENIQRIEVRVHQDVAHYLQNRKRKEIARLEETGQIQVFVTGLAGVSPELLDFLCLDRNNNEVKFLPFEEPNQRRRLPGRGRS